MTQTLPGADIRRYYTALGVALPTWASENASVRCFTDPTNTITATTTPHAASTSPPARSTATAATHTAAPTTPRSSSDTPPRSAIALMIRYGLIKRRRTPPHRRATPRSHQPPPPTERTVPPLGLQPLILQRVVRQRAWSVSTIRAFEVGIDGDRITIPVRNELGQLVGLLRYTPWPPGRSDKMHAAAGSHRQLLPDPAGEPSSRVLLVEGGPDMLAARTRGLPAIAVPGVGCWRASWAELLVGRQIMIVMDADNQGRATATRIAQDLSDRAATETVEVVAPIRGCRDRALPD